MTLGFAVPENAVAAVPRIALDDPQPPFLFTGCGFATLLIVSKRAHAPLAADLVVAPESSCGGGGEAILNFLMLAALLSSSSMAVKLSPIGWISSHGHSPL